MLRVIMMSLCMLASTPLCAAQAWMLLDADTDAGLVADDRKQVAEDLLSRLEQLRSRIPAQSPADVEAIEKRLASLDDLTLASERRGRFFLSLDYQHYQLVQLLDDARQQLGCIIEATREETELACWSRLAQIYLAEERIGLGLSTLRAARRLPRDDDMPTSAQDPLVWYSEFGRGILRRIITPWLTSLVIPAGGDE